MKIMQKIALAVAALATVGGAATMMAPAASAADGNVYAYDGTYFSGKYCGWVGNDTNWTTCSGGGVAQNLRNQASSLWNNGYSGGNDDVNFYWDTGYSGAWACLGTGDYWADLPLGVEHFTWGPGLGGYGDTLNNNISSHKWVSYCGQA